MKPAPRNHFADLRGASRLAIDASLGLAGLVEAMHTRIARMPLKVGGPVVEGAVNGISWFVYRAIDGVTRAAGGGLEILLAQLATVLGDTESSPGREAVLAALNGVLGDYLAEIENPLAIAMQVRNDAKTVELTREGVAAAFPQPSGKIVVLVHGLCMNDLQWNRSAHCHGSELARHHGYTPVYIHYNSGQHVSTNGRTLTTMLESLVATWPTSVHELTIVAHSMGGLVSRSAHHYGTLAGHRWTRLLRNLVFLGTPHHGASLERGGHRLQRLVEKTPYAAPFARLGKIRSAGITDLRHGNLLDDDWRDRDRFAEGADTRRPVPLPDDVRCFAVAATRSKSADDLRSRVVGDGLVPLPSALGRHENPRFTLAFPKTHQWIAYETGHFGLLDRHVVYERIRDWLAD